MSRVTILSACMQAVESGETLSAEKIYERIVDRKLYEFRAKDPRSMVRAALRKHVRSNHQPHFEISGGFFRKR